MEGREQDPLHDIARFPPEVPSDSYDCINSGAGSLQESKAGQETFPCVLSCRESFSFTIVV